MDFRELMADFAAKVGLEDFAPNAEGVCQLIDESTVITIQDCGEIGLILVTAPLAKLPKRAGAGLLRTLLGANFLYEKTMGATVALDEENGTLYLTRYDALAQLDGERLRTRLERFATVLDLWRREIGCKASGTKACRRKVCR